MTHGMGRLVRYLADALVWGSVILVPLGLWQTLEILVWVTRRLVVGC